MKQKLEAKGWIMFHECNTCSGHRQFFKNVAHPDYEIRIKIKNQTFSILFKNLIVAGPFWGFQIEEKLTQYVK